ncbi:MAG: hypothetical protein J5999_11815 [Oscillospiraceae bacterium]|nr:hypothetical protein [Oscillospiraceae bacterium]
MRKISKWFSAAAAIITAFIMSAVTAAAADDDICLFEGEGRSNGKWGQAYSLNIRANDKYAQLMTMLNENSKIYVDFSLEGTPSPNTQGIEFILQKWEKQGGDSVWAQTPPIDVTDGVATFDYASLVKTFGSDDLSGVDQIYIGDTHAVIKVTRVVFDIYGDGINGDTADVPEVGAVLAPPETTAEETSAADLDDKPEETTAAADEKITEESATPKASEQTEETTAVSEEKNGSLTTEAVVVIVIISVTFVAAVIIVIIDRTRKKYY